MWRSITVNQNRAIFGVSGEDFVGKEAFPAIEAAPCFSSSFPEIFNGRRDIPCIIPAAIDQVFIWVCQTFSCYLGATKFSIFFVLVT